MHLLLLLLNFNFKRAAPAKKSFVFFEKSFVVKIYHKTTKDNKATLIVTRVKKVYIRMMF